METLLIKLKFQLIILKEIILVIVLYKQLIYHPKSSKQIVNSSNKWKYLLKNTKLSANKTHKFKNSLMKKDKINHIKINIFPDGGISRFRIFGKKI